MRFVLICVLVALCVAQARSEDGWWTKLKKSVREFVESIRGIWDEMKDEIKSRTVDMREWSQDMFNSFKVKMREWVNEIKASDTEKNELRDYIERLKMPEAGEEI